MKKKKSKSNVNLDDVEIDFGEEESEEAVSIASVPALVTTIDSVELPAAWGQTSASIDEVRKHRQMFNLKHGLFANVPLVCKGTKCPWFDTCTVSVKPVGQRCPIEIAAIIEQYDKYCTQLNVGDDYFAQSQVKDLVDTEIKLLRANGLLALSGNFIEQVVVGIDDKGNAHTKPELHKATDYEQQLLARKRQILADLNATRKQKKSDERMSDPSSFASELMRKAMKAQSMMQAVVVDADYASVSDDPDTPQESGDV